MVVVVMVAKQENVVTVVAKMDVAKIKKNVAHKDELILLLYK